MVAIRSFTPPESPVRFQDARTRVFLNERDFGLGTLYVTESLLSWEGSESSFSLEYPHMCTHALSSDTTIHPTECVYIMIDAYVNMPGHESEGPTRPMRSDGDDDDDDEEEEEGENFSLLVMVPDSKESLKPLYEAISVCSSLNPDPADFSDEDDEDELFDDFEEGLEIGSGDTFDGQNAASIQRMANLNLNSHQNGVGDQANSVEAEMNEEQFEDAD